MEVVGVGIATIDVIHDVAAYPQEDSKVRALSAKKRRGGNVSNALVVCSQLGATCRWMGTTTDPKRDGDAAFVYDDLNKYAVDMSLASVVVSGAMPVSYILSSRATGSRTIIHHRDLPELSFDSFRELLGCLSPINLPRWFHFEGRNLGNVALMMQYVRTHSPSSMISVEIEALRNEWEDTRRLGALADVVFVSKDYIREKLQLSNANAFFQSVIGMQCPESRPIVWICPWGSTGVYFMDRTQCDHIPTASLDVVHDSVGAGDSFIGATIAALAYDVPLVDALRMACRVATTKCTIEGFELPKELILEAQLMLQNVKPKLKLVSKPEEVRSVSLTAM
ncbi:hypothetical protein Poli38472_008675 [Pythium oligandrum]|uniref:Carbohydrate kinase PfkB domain-containing protein n=1 Tax=Pythium oligandrum TaxID=41045 RepID=A0A8K1FDW9_PYTOL|nr:hypothetical protein Poli38472_008675 [Pythium oligandrum]|eukprot:TMW56027.1 hypothetical protein Poli38472_008675 [Pythium oligandrum]